MTAPATTSKSALGWLANHWFALFLAFYGLWVWTPWLAPIFMHMGWNNLGIGIYSIYKFFCHQLPERSFFLFGQKPMYSLIEIQAAWPNAVNPLLLRTFIGNPVMGWKVAWSDRMVSFYGSIWILALVWWPFRRKVKPLALWGFILLLFPMAIDGGTHFLSDLAGIDQGFRESNQWLALLTNHIFPASFYVGNALGSFNSWMRLISGLLAGLGIAWLAFPHLFKAQVLDQELEKYNYGKVIAQIREKCDPRSSS